MCLICIEMDKQRLSSQEALRNFKEMKTDLGKEHEKEVKQKIFDKMIEESARRRKSEDNSGRTDSD